MRRAFINLLIASCRPLLRRRLWPLARLPHRDEAVSFVTPWVQRGGLQGALPEEAFSGVARFSIIMGHTHKAGAALRPEFLALNLALGNCAPKMPQTSG